MLVVLAGGLPVLVRLDWVRSMRCGLVQGDDRIVHLLPLRPRVLHGLDGPVGVQSLLGGDVPKWVRRTELPAVRSRLVPGQHGVVVVRSVRARKLR